MCAFCEEGYSASGTGKTGTCTACPESKAGSYALIFFATLGAAIALVIVYGIVLFSDHEIVETLRKGKVKQFHSPDERLLMNHGKKVKQSAVDGDSADSSEDSTGRVSVVLEPEEVTTRQEKFRRLIEFGASGLETRIKYNIMMCCF